MKRTSHKILSRTVNLLATRYWLSLILHKKKLRSIHELGKWLYESKEENKGKYCPPNESKRFYKNNDGTSPIEDTRVIDDIEEQIPGTRRSLKHSLWEILKNPNPSEKELHQFMQQIHPDLTRKLFSLDETTGLLKRRPHITRGEIIRIESLNNLDGLACLLCLMYEAEAKNHMKLHLQISWSVHLLFFRLAAFPPMNNIAHDMYHLLYDRFLNPKQRYVKLQQWFKLEEPPHITDVDGRIELNTWVLEFAKALKLVPHKEKELLRFLFWVDLGPKLEILTVLKDWYETGALKPKFKIQILKLKEKMKGGLRNGNLRGWK